MITEKKNHIIGKKEFFWQLVIILTISLALIALKEMRLVSTTILLILQYIGIYSILALGINIVNGYLGVFSLAHAGFMAIGAYVSAYLSKYFFMTRTLFAVSILAGAVAALLLGILVAIPSFKTKGDYLAIITLGFSLIVQSVLQNMQFVGGSQGLDNIPKYTNIYWVFGCLLIVVFITHKFIHSKYGRSMKAIREDEPASVLVSVDVRRIKTIAFALSAFLIGISGALIGHLLGYTSPSSYGFVNIVDGLVMVYLGGMGSIVGSIFGSTAWQLIVQAFKQFGTWRWVIGGVLLIFVMVFLPKGVFGNMELKDAYNVIKDKFKGQKSRESNHNE
jgi:branched-chain amino acid transport system permease protein